MQESLNHSFHQIFLALVVIVVSHPRKFYVIEVDMRIFGDNYRPPSPHQTAQHPTHHQVSHQPLPLLNVLRLFPQYLKLLLELLMRQILTNNIGIDESYSHLLAIGFLRQYCEVRSFSHIVIYLTLFEVVGDIEKRKVERAIFVVNENEFAIIFSNQNIICQQIIMGEDQRFFLVFLYDRRNELYLICCHPSLENFNLFLLFRGVNIFFKFFMANLQHFCFFIDEGLPDQILIRNMFRFWFDMMEMGQSIGHFLQISRNQHIFCLQDRRLNEFFQSNLLVEVIDLRSVT